LRQASFFIKKLRFLRLEAMDMDLDGKLQVCWNNISIIWFSLEKFTINRA
jgi:hypothetical protein